MVYCRFKEIGGYRLTLSLLSGTGLRFERFCLSNGAECSQALPGRCMIGCPGLRRRLDTKLLFKFMGQSGVVCLSLSRLTKPAIKADDLPVQILSMIRFAERTQGAPARRRPVPEPHEFGPVPARPQYIPRGNLRDEPQSNPLNAPEDSYLDTA